jgi:26S proteasome regulatory subunit N8
VNNFQDIFNLLPNLKVEQIVRSFSVKSNDYMYVMYVSGLIRSILSLHDLINNKINAKEIELETLKREKEEEAEKKKKEEEASKKKGEAAAAKINESESK